MTEKERHIDTVARTIIGEARGQYFLDMLGIACVVRERSLRPGWWGKDASGVCKHPYQFTCWQDHNLKAVNNAHALPQWNLAKAAAEVALLHLRDQDIMNLFGVNSVAELPTHYHDHSIDTPYHSWGRDLTEIKVPWKSDFRWYCVRQGRPPRTKTEAV